MARSSSGQRAGALLALLFISLGGTSSATAAEGVDDAGGIVYEAPPECPSKSELLAAIDARATPSHEVDQRTFRVAIERARDGSFEGRLEVVGASQAPRMTRAADCVAVMRTLALFVVIARTPERPADTPAPEPPPPPPTAPLGGAVKPRPQKKVPPPATAHLRYAASVRASLLLGSSSPSSATPATGARVQNELAWLPARSPLAPLVRLSFGTASFDTKVDSGSASFRFRTGRLEGCAAIDLGLALALVPCVGGEIGDLVATTSNRPVPVRASTRWQAATVGSGLRWSILPWLSLGADLVALVPFTRKKFGVVDPVRVIYAVPVTFFDLGAVASVSARFD